MDLEVGQEYHRDFSGKPSRFTGQVICVVYVCLQVRGTRFKQASSQVGTQSMWLKCFSLWEGLATIKVVTFRRCLETGLFQKRVTSSESVRLLKRGAKLHYSCSKILGKDIYGGGGSHAEWETAVLGGHQGGQFQSFPGVPSWGGGNCDKEVRAGLANFFCKRPDRKHFMLRELVFSVVPIKSSSLSTPGLERDEDFKC